MPDEPKFSDRARAFLDAQGQTTKHVVEPDQYGFDQTQFSKIPTQAELNNLEAGRATPAPSFDIDGLNPGTWTAAQIEAERQREERIDFLHDRLGQEQENFEAN